MFDIDHINELRAELAGCWFYEKRAQADRRRVGRPLSRSATTSGPSTPSPAANLALGDPLPARADPIGEGARAPLPRFITFYVPAFEDRRR